jgi:hypothetical protein
MTCNINVLLSWLERGHYSCKIARQHVVFILDFDMNHNDPRYFRGAPYQDCDN